MAGIVASGGATATAIYQPMVLLGAAGVAFMLIVGVVLPAVWSRKKERRAAAVRMLRELLTAIRPVIPTPTPLATASTDRAEIGSGRVVLP
jgi:NADH:ubiquinone oxidoreductase subunit 6 (subunit J)